jgi:D-glycero-alpha-D-manno-heptose 1-phosphate guanylyltransferase
MEAIILAGGFGTRLSSVNPLLPKPMALICARPFLEILMSSLAQKGFTRIILSLGYKAEIILSHFGRNYAGMDVDYVVEDTPLGTGGAIRLAMTKTISDHVYIFNGDTFLDLDIAPLEIEWREHRKSIIVGCMIENVERYGKILFEKNRVVNFIEKGVSGPGVINAGCYILNRDQLINFELHKKFSFESDYLPEAISQVGFNLFIASGFFIDIGIPEDFLRAQILLKNY